MRSNKRHIRKIREFECFSFENAFFLKCHSISGRCHATLVGFEEPFCFKRKEEKRHFIFILVKVLEKNGKENE